MPSLALRAPEGGAGVPRSFPLDRAASAAWLAGAAVDPELRLRIEAARRATADRRRRVCEREHVRRELFALR